MWWLLQRSSHARQPPPPPPPSPPPSPRPAVWACAALARSSGAQPSGMKSCSCDASPPSSPSSRHHHCARAQTRLALGGPWSRLAVVTTLAAVRASHGHAMGPGATRGCGPAGRAIAIHKGIDHNQNWLRFPYVDEQSRAVLGGRGGTVPTAPRAVAVSWMHAHKGTGSQPAAAT
jgi:hypothetical protein